MAVHLFGDLLQALALAVTGTFRGVGPQAKGSYPAYVLTDTTGATWSVVAVADAQLDFAAK